MSYVCTGCLRSADARIIDTSYGDRPRLEAVSVCCEAPIIDADSELQVDATDLRERWAEQKADMEYEARYA